MKGLAALTALVLAAPLSAQAVSDCDWRASALALVEPWEDNSRTFSNGQTRLALTDTIEPAAGAFHIVILSPPYDELGGRQCKVVSLDGSIGFSGVEFGAMNANYDPSVGLIFDLPVQVFDAPSGGFVSNWLNLAVNQATGQIDAWLGGGD
ncbi:hypothetical protein PGB28_18780 [Primorskyibacter aestuariivivens]|uniref:hypothetical protein n=1 Tax=Primorskyibacter aestuariivivens TaxID=1888912 RepID=UPI00230174BC|nr:hypothetical protein [Primorskyibacter aestuariivivens]MDA7430511.1 hypothetical protein [Primorskyibacter aestuariivivens]